MSTELYVAPETNFIAGRWVAAQSGETFPTFAPSTDRLVGVIPVTRPFSSLRFPERWRCARADGS